MRSFPQIHAALRSAWISRTAQPGPAAPGCARTPHSAQQPPFAPATTRRHIPHDTTITTHPCVPSAPAVGRARETKRELGRRRLLGSVLTPRRNSPNTNSPKYTHNHVPRHTHSIAGGGGAPRDFRAQARPPRRESATHRSGEEEERSGGAERRSGSPFSLLSSERGSGGAGRRARGAGRGGRSRECVAAGYYRVSASHA